MFLGFLDYLEERPHKYHVCPCKSEVPRNHFFECLVCESTPENVSLAKKAFLYKKLAIRLCKLCVGKPYE